MEPMDESPSNAMTLRRRRAQSLMFSPLDATPSVLLIGLSNSYICVCEVRCTGSWSSVILIKIFQNV